MYLRGHGAPPNQRQGMRSRTGWQVQPTRIERQFNQDTLPAINATYNPRFIPPPLPTQSQLSSDLDSSFDSEGEDDELESSKPVEGDVEEEAAFAREEQAELDNDPEAGFSEDWREQNANSCLATEVLSQPPITAMHWNRRQEDEGQEMISVSQGVSAPKLQDSRTNALAMLQTYGSDIASPSPKRPAMLAPSEVFKSTLKHLRDSDSEDENDIFQPPSPSPLPRQHGGRPIRAHSAIPAVQAPVNRDYPFRSHSTLPSSEVHATNLTIPPGQYRNLPSWANPIPPEDVIANPSIIESASLHLPTHRPPSSRPSSAHIPTGRLPFSALPSSTLPSSVCPPSAHPSLARPSSESTDPPLARTYPAHPFSVRPPSVQPPSARAPSTRPLSTRPPSTRPPSVHPPSAQLPTTHPSEQSAHPPLTHSPSEQPSTTHSSVELPAAHLSGPSNAASSTLAPPASTHTSAPFSTELDDFLEDKETSGDGQNNVPTSRKGRISHEALEKVDQAIQAATKLLQDVGTACDIPFDTIIKRAFPQLERRRLNQFNGFQKMYRAMHEGPYDMSDVRREYNLTKEKLSEDDFQDLLGVSNSLETLDNETMTWGSRKAAFRREQSQLTKALQNLSERFAFESALIIVGSHLEDGPTMGQLFETRCASNFFEEKFRCTPKLLINHLQAYSRNAHSNEIASLQRDDLHTGDNTLQDATKQDTEHGTHDNLQQEATKRNPSPARSVHVTVRGYEYAATQNCYKEQTTEEKHGKWRPFALTKADSLAQESARANMTSLCRHYNVAIRTKLHFESGHPSSTMFPWSKLPSALHEAGRTMVNWPSECPLPVTDNSDTVTPYLPKGFFGYSEAQQLSMAKALESGVMQIVPMIDKDTNIVIRTTPLSANKDIYYQLEYDVAQKEARRTICGLQEDGDSEAFRSKTDDAPNHRPVAKPTKEKSQKQRRKRTTRENLESNHAHEEEPSAKKVKVTAQERGASMQAGPSHVPSNPFFAPSENHTAPSSGFGAALHPEIGDEGSTLHAMGQYMNEGGYNNGEAAHSSENAPPRMINIGGQIYQLRD